MKNLESDIPDILTDYLQVKVTKLLESKGTAHAKAKRISSHLVTDDNRHIAERAFEGDADAMTQLVERAAIIGLEEAARSWFGF